jgi:hypothetical protein
LQGYYPTSVLPKKDRIDEKFNAVKGKAENQTEKINLCSDELKEQVYFLQTKLNRVAWYAMLRDSGEIFKYSTKQRGSHSYSSQMSEKLEMITENLREKDGEPLFLTATFAPEQNGRSIIESFKKGREELRIFHRKLKKMGYIYQMGSIEATEKGYFHAHLIVSDGKTIYAKWYDEKHKCYRLDDETLRETLKAKWRLGFLDIAVVKRDKKFIEACQYVTKYAGKYGYVEEALKRARLNDYADDEEGEKQRSEDKKKIHTHYYASIGKFRLFSCTRNLSATKQIERIKTYIEELDIHIAFCVLFGSMNNVTRSPRQKEIKITKETMNEPWFTRKTGKIEKNTIEYYQLMDIFDKTDWTDRYCIIKDSETEALAEAALEITA